MGIDPAILDMQKITRLAHDFFEPPIVNGKSLAGDDMRRLAQFITTLADQMDANQTKREKPLSRDELARMIMAAAKWSLEEFAK